jgi:hypothetical protein
LSERFNQFFNKLSTETDPWIATSSIQNYVSKALAWTFADRLEATGSFQHTFTPDFYVHLQPGPRLAIHMRFSFISASSLIADLLRQRPSDFKHIVLVKGTLPKLFDERSAIRLNKRPDILITSFDLVDQILRVVDLLEELGPYRLGRRFMGLQRKLETWCLEAHGILDSPTVEEFAPTFRLRSLLPGIPQRAKSVGIWTANGVEDLSLRYLADSTLLGTHRVNAKQFSEVSRGRTHECIKRVLEIARPTLLLTRIHEHIHEPLLACVFSKHAPMGQNAYQVLPKVMACAESGIPSFIIAPEKGAVSRRNGSHTVEKAHPILFQALTRIMDIYKIPVLFLPWPTDEDAHGVPILREEKRFIGMPDRATPALQLLFQCVNHALTSGLEGDGKLDLLGYSGVVRKRLEMGENRFRLGTRALEEPPKGSGVLLPTSELRHYIQKELGGIGRALLQQVIQSRHTSLVMTTSSTSLRADPYLGTLLAFDFAFCRTGPKIRDRSANLIAHFRGVSLSSAISRLFSDGRLDVLRHTREALFLKYADAIFLKDGALVKDGEDWQVVE